MKRRILFVIACLGVLAPSASAHVRCVRDDEQVLARSAQAVVLSRMAATRQTLIGCSRASGRRRTIDVLPRDGDHRLVGLRLAGTRIAYVQWGVTAHGESQPTLMAEDAVHGGRRHALINAAGPYVLPEELTWGVDAQGDVAWLAEVSRASSAALGVPPVLMAWRPGRGGRQIDARARLDGLRLVDGVLRWRRDGAPRSFDLTTIPPSACPPGADSGTLAVDMIGLFSFCLRTTGRTFQMPLTDSSKVLLDANGPYVAIQWAQRLYAGAFVYDARNGVAEAIDATPADPDDLPYGSIADAVVDDHGSTAWITRNGLWVRDAAGTRKVAEPGAGTGPLLRDGSTVTWSGGGPTVTLNP